jgi:hypothetical protein
VASIVWAPRALDDIDALILYISRDSAIRARRFASRMVSRIDSLASQPESGSWLPEDDGLQKWKADSNQWQSPLQHRGKLSLTIEVQFVIARSLECDQASSGESMISKIQLAAKWPHEVHPRISSESFT